MVDVLFGDPMPKPEYPPRLLYMHKIYGVTAGRTCGACRNLLTESGWAARRWFKCALARQSSSTATDWRRRWPACGKFVEEAD